jgi:hypothetical protein
VVNNATDTWKTPELREAEANLRTAVEHGQETVAKARQLKARMRPTRISDEDVKAIERAARSADAPPELRALADRVERGSLTWRQIVDGKAVDDPDVRAAMAVNLERMGRVYHKFAEGHSVDDVLDSETGRRARRDDSGDDDGPTVLKHDAW